MTTLWTWIPSLNSDISMTRIPKPISSYVAVPWDSYNSAKVTSVSSDGCLVDNDLHGLKDIPVSIVQGFLCIRNLDDHGDPTVAESIFAAAKRAFHIDITHHESSGLKPVVADTLNEAIRMTCCNMARSIYSANAFQRVYGQLPFASDSVKNVGLIVYGSSFVDRYRDELGDDFYFYREFFDSFLVFNDEMYDYYRNECIDALSRKSVRLSKTSVELNRSVTVMTRVVVMLTLASLMLSLFDHMAL